MDRVVWPEAQLAEDIERIVSVPDAIDAEVFADGAIRLLEYRIDQRSSIVDRRIADLHLPHGSLIVAVRRGESFFIPRGDSVLVSGDKAIVMGTPDALSQVQRQITGSANLRRQRVTIVGGGDVGLRLAERLDGTDGVDVTVIERDVERGEMLASRLRHSLVLSGDGTDLELLEAEDIGRSDVLVSVIDNDERNLLASLLGRQLGVRRIITRVSRLANLRLFERVGIDVAFRRAAPRSPPSSIRLPADPTRLLAVVEQGAGRILELDVPAGLRDAQPARDGSAAQQHHRRDHSRGAGDRAARHRPRPARRPADRLHDSRRGRSRAQLLHPSRSGRPMRLAVVVSR